MGFRCSGPLGAFVAVLISWRAGSAAESAEPEPPEQPWSDNLLFDINAGTPVIKSEDIRLSGDALLGYRRGNFGVVGRGDLAYYDLQGESTLSNTLREGGSIDAWSLPVSRRGFRLELRASGELELYDTELIDASPGSVDVLSQETSLMWRASLLVAGRYEPSSALATGLWLGTGVQSEQYDALNLTGTTVTAAQRDSVSVLVTARFRLQAAVVPSVLTFRARSDFKYYQITRDSLETDVTASDVSIVETAVASSQLESLNRVFLDAEVARVFDFVPGIAAGLDVVSLAPATGPPYTTVVPFVGVGIRRTAY
jgi:hypothetical protein